MAAVSHKWGLPTPKTSSGGITNIVGYELRPNDLWEKTFAMGYKVGAHRLEDSKRTTETYVSKILKE